MIREELTGKKCGDSGHELIWGINPGSFLEGLRKTTKTSVNMTGLGSKNEYINLLCKYKSKEFFFDDFSPTYKR
jgi:hypothetical protein